MSQEAKKNPAVRPLTIFILAMINVAAICSIKNWPISAQYGFSSLFYFLFSTVFFFIPTALVSAELASGWPERGGIYVWVKEAFGHRWGFLAVWLLWAENIAWYPTVLSFIAGTIAYTFAPSLADSKIYTFAVVLIVYWSITLINLKGIRVSGLISSLGVIFGTILPGAIIIGLGCAWYFGGHPLQTTISWKALVPDLSSGGQIALLAGLLLSFAGIEMSAVHAKDVVNPQKNYPRAIFLSAIIILVLSILGTLAISIVIPQGNISLVSGGIEAIAYFLKSYNLNWLVPVIAILIAFGALGQISTWTAGPSRGLLAAAQDGDLPPMFHKVNKHQMPITMLIVQGIVISLLSLVFLFLPNVSSSFWMLIALTAQLYLLMYILMFVAAIRLRYKKPHVVRAYKIPLGNFGIWFISLLGLAGCLFSITIGFFPPSHLDFGTSRFFVSFLLIGMLVMSAAPFVILLFKKPSWAQVKSEHHE